MMIRTSQLIRNAVLSLSIVIASALLVGGVKGQEQSGDDQPKQQWSKSTNERDSRIEIARRGQYQIRYIFFSGKFGIRDHELRKLLRPGFRDGDVFDLSALNQSMKHLSKFKRIYPVTLENIDVTLDEKEKLADFAVKIVEKGNINQK